MMVRCEKLQQTHWNTFQHTATHCTHTYNSQQVTAHELCNAGSVRHASLQIDKSCCTYECVMSPIHMSHSTRVVQTLEMCDMTHSCDTREYVMPHTRMSDVTHVRMMHDSQTTHRRCMTPGNVRHDSFVRALQDSLVCVWHDLFTCVT